MRILDAVRAFGDVGFDALNGPQGFGAEADAEAFGQAVELLVGDGVFLFEEEDLFFGQALGDGDGEAEAGEAVGLVVLVATERRSDGATKGEEVVSGLPSLRRFVPSSLRRFARTAARRRP